MTITESKIVSETINTTTRKIPRKKPRNPFGRKFNPQKSSAILASVKENLIVLEQFNADMNHKLFRPIIFSPFPVSPKQTQTVDSKAQATTAIAANPDAPTTPKTQKLQTHPLQTPNGIHKTLPFRMETPNGTVMNSARSQEIDIDGLRKTLFFASPPNRPKDAGKKVHSRNVESKQESKSKKRRFSLFQEVKSNNAIEKQSKASVKGGQTITVDLHKRRRRDFPQAKTIMGFTAKNALKAAIKKKKDVYTEDKIQLMNSMLGLSLEHLHRIAFSLSPKEYNPQVSDNLGVSGSWINTNMMVLETVASFFAKKFKESKSKMETTKEVTEVVAITPTFKMLPDSPIIDEISYEVLLKANGKQLTINHTIQALALPDRGNWPSSTDAEQTRIVAEALLSDTPPDRSTTVSIRRP